MGPPPGSGIILAYILRILDGMLPAPDAGLDAHRLVEAFKFGFGERSRLGDSRFVDVSKVCISFGKTDMESIKTTCFVDLRKSEIGQLHRKYTGQHIR